MVVRRWFAGCISNVLCKHAVYDGAIVIVRLYRPVSSTFRKSFRSISKVFANSLLLSVRQKFPTSLAGYDGIFGKKKPMVPPMSPMQQ
jgi:hypothetical protein